MNPVGICTSTRYRMQTVEDDLGWAPDVALKISSENRNVNGVVFEDYTDSEFKVGQERKGNGILTSQDTKQALFANMD